MTINELQDHLIREIEDLTKEMYITDSQGDCTELKGYPQSVGAESLWGEVHTNTEPEQTEDKRIPYFIVRMDKVEYRKKEAEHRNQAHVFVEVNICESDTEKRGFYTLAAVLERVIGRFQSGMSLGPFWCEREMAAVFKKENEFPYCRGEIEMFWNLPDILTGEVL